MTIFSKPIFAIPDALSAENELKAKYTELTGKELFPAQPEALLSNWAAYLKTVTDTLIQFTGEQCLVNYAIGDNLDALGAFWDTPRLDAQSSITTILFTLTSVQGSDYIVPEGTKVQSRDNLFLFATTANLIIPSGDLSGSISAVCTVAGEESNGYAIGQINQLFDLLSDIASVANTSVSNSGASIETDDRYRERLLIAPNKISTAGSKDSYKFLVLSADSNISAVAISSPTDTERIEREEELALELGELLRDNLQDYGVDINLFTAENIAPLFRQFIKIPRFSVDIYLLAKDGLPSLELIDKVQTFLDNDNIRPLTDMVKVFSAIEIEQNISVEIIADINADIADLTSRLNIIIEDYRNDLSSNLGKDIVPSQIIQKMQIGGVYSVNLIEPIETVKIEFNQRVIVPNFNLDIVGVSAG